MFRKQLLLFLFLICYLSQTDMIIYAKEYNEENSTIKLYAHSAVLMDADSGRVLFAKEKNKIMPMASTTKIMSCILALEEMEADQIVKISEQAESQPKVKLGVQVGEQYRLIDLLYSMMLESHNDSTVAVAESISGNEESFVLAMNEKAKEIGCEQTYFVTANGLDGKDEYGVHSTTAEDLARIMKYCITESSKRMDFLTISQTKVYTFSNLQKDRTFYCENHNRFLNMMEGAFAGKTGFTNDAGYCYVGALKSRGRTFIVSLLGCGWPNNRGYKWADTKKLMQFGIEHYLYRNFKLNKQEIKIQIPYGMDQRNHIIKDMQEVISLKSYNRKVLCTDEEVLKTILEYTKVKNAPVIKGSTAGIVKLYIDEMEIDRIPFFHSQTIYTVDFAKSYSYLMKKITFY